MKRNREDQIVGEMLLEPDIDVLPAGLLSTHKKRLELCEKQSPDEAWVAEATICGELPWRSGEKRIVELRIMDELFREKVLAERPRLLAKRGNFNIGTISLA